MDCCNEGEKRGWSKEVFREGLCVRTHRVTLPTRVGLQTAHPGDRIVRIPALNATFVVNDEQYQEWFDPLVEEEHAD